MTILEAFSLLYFVMLLQSNKRRQVSEFVNNAMHTLTERYQLQVGNPTPALRHSLLPRRMSE